MTPMGSADARKGGSMRPPQLPLTRPLSSQSRPSADRRQADEKAPAQAKPPKKRSLNEAAHKLGY
jgi:hypothetical protein